MNVIDDRCARREKIKKINYKNSMIHGDQFFFNRNFHGDFSPREYRRTIELYSKHWTRVSLVRLIAQGEEEEEVEGDPSRPMQLCITPTLLKG